MFVSTYYRVKHIITILFLLFPQLISAQEFSLNKPLHSTDPPVHQYIAYKAFKIIENTPIYSDLYSDMSGYVGYLGNESVNSDYFPVDDEGGSICEGAEEEDQWGSEIPPSVPGWETTYFTHFWNPDIIISSYDDFSAGLLLPIVIYDFSKMKFVEKSFQYMSAPQKALRYFHEAIIFYNNNEKSNAYYLLGKIAHLLTDMSVPAHVLCDMHPGDLKGKIIELLSSYNDYGPGDNYEIYIGEGEKFESWPKSGLTAWDWNTMPMPSEYAKYDQLRNNESWDQYESGLFKLFLKLAEMTDEYDSDEFMGEKNPGSMNGYNNQEGSSWGKEVVTDENCKIIADDLMPASMEAVAGLYQLFWDATHQPPSYTINTFAGLHGTINPLNAEASEGEDKTFTATPDEKYDVESWFLDGNVVQSSGSSYTILNIQKNHVLLVTFKEIPDQPEIIVTAPVEGGKYSRGTSMYIGWSYNHIPGELLLIELINGSSIVKLVHGEYPANLSNIPWKIPSDIAIDTGYKIRISSNLHSTVGESGTFEIKEKIDRSVVVELRTVEDLQTKIEEYGYYKLMNTIEAGGFPFIPIDSFKGTLDGQGYSIHDLKIERLDDDNVGLFRIVHQTAIIKDLIIDEQIVYGHSIVGAIAGYFDGTIVNCHTTNVEVKGNIASAGSDIGGLVGQNHGIIRNCSAVVFSNGDVRGYGKKVGGIAGENFPDGVIEFCWTIFTEIAGQDDAGATISRIGGIVGENYGTIRQCYNSSTIVKSHSIWAGGIAGYNNGSGIIEDSYSLSKVLGEQIGGIVGKNEGTIERCYAAGYIADVLGGGLIGDSNGGTAINCFWDIDVTGKSDSYDNPGGTFTNCQGKTTSEMIQQSTFTASGWDFENVWIIEEGISYPTLRGCQPSLDISTVVTASNNREDGIEVSWVSVTNAGCYKVYRADSMDGEKQEMSEWISETNYLDTSPITDASYWYWVKAAITNKGDLVAGESDFNENAGEGKRIFVIHPPENVSASDNFSNNILVEWDAAPVSGYYRVQRSNISISNWITETSFIDTTVDAGTEYVYTVQAAIDDSGKNASIPSAPDTGSKSIAKGSIRVVISPQPVVDNGAEWYVGDLGPFSSSDIVPDLPVGTHELTFTDVENWDSPSLVDVVVREGKTNDAIAKYIIQTGTLTVTIEPEQAVNDSAQWCVDKSILLNSGTTVILPAGDHKIEFYGIIGWLPPDSLEVKITNNGEAIISGEFTKVVEINNHFVPVLNTGYNATIAITTDTNSLIDEIPLAIGDEIGVFTFRGICVGAVVWEGKDTELSVCGDDQETADTVEGIIPGEDYIFRIWQKATETEYNVYATYSTGNATYFQDAIAILESLSSIKPSVEEILAPAKFSLVQNAPNPFNPTTTITYAIPAGKYENVNLKIYDIRGTLIRTLVDEAGTPGVHSVVWDGVDNSGNAVSSGVYIYRLHAGKYIKSNRMTLVR
ncbi:FlgD immunoglobulin-like domain containing protein [Candidatus Latescibacterota bacterium]